MENFNTRQRVELNKGKLTKKSKKGASESNQAWGWGFLRPSRLVYIFHPAVLSLLLMILVLTLKVHQLVTIGSRSSFIRKPSKENVGVLITANNSSGLAYKSVHTRLPSTTLARLFSKRNYTYRNRTRQKRSAEEPVVEHVPEESAQEPSTPEVSLDPHKRPIPLTSLDDMLLDGETPVPVTSCLQTDAIIYLEGKEKMQRASRIGLSEHNEPCNATDDCLLLSPYFWTQQGTREPCRKRTYLRCNLTEGECQCADKFDIRWDTSSNQSVYQWNPITKTCYVRPTNPCKQDVPCAPGTTCRTTVSISYNTPPLQTICECENTDLIPSAGNEEWWYCKEYWQRTWYFDLDNINKWKHESAHLYNRIHHHKNKTEKKDPGN